MAEDELIGFHKGCINTLVGERQALVNMVNDVDKLIQMHLAELKKLGVDVEAMLSQGQEKYEQPKNPPTKKVSEEFSSYNRRLG